MAVDINATMNNMLDSMKTVGKSTEEPKDLMDIITGAFDRMVGGVAKIAGVSFVAKLGSQSVFAQAEIPGLGVINKAAQSFSSQGGALYNALSSMLTFDFKGLVASAVEPLQSLGADGLHGTNVSYGELGQLTPMVTFGGSVISEGLSIA